MSVERSVCMEAAAVFLTRAAAKVMVKNKYGRVMAIGGNSFYECDPIVTAHGNAKVALCKAMQSLAVAYSPYINIKPAKRQYSLLCKRVISYLPAMIYNYKCIKRYDWETRIIPFCYFGANGRIMPNFRQIKKLGGKCRKLSWHRICII